MFKKSSNLSLVIFFFLRKKGQRLLKLPQWFAIYSFRSTVPGMASLNVLIHAINLWVERFLTPLMAEGSKFQQGCLPLVGAWVTTSDFLLYSIPRLSEVSILVRIHPFVKYLSRRTLRMTAMFKLFTRWGLMGHGTKFYHTREHTDFLMLSQPETYTLTLALDGQSVVRQADGISYFARFQALQIGSTGSFCQRLTYTLLEAVLWSRPCLQPWWMLGNPLTPLNMNSPIHCGCHACSSFPTRSALCVSEVHSDAV